MDFNDLSDEDKDLMYNTAQKHIGENMVILLVKIE